jgi:SAM-dependent methyltransferase
MRETVNAPQGAALAALLPKLACPACGGALTLAEHTLMCTSCAAPYRVERGVPVLLGAASAAMIAAFRGDAENVKLRSQLARSPGLLRLADLIRAPHPFWFMRRRASHAQRIAFTQLSERNGQPGDALFLDIGSGILGGANASGLSERIRQRTVSLEIAPTAGVGVVGDAHHLPFRDASVDGLLIQGVLEHVLDPDRIVSEIFRVLKPGAPVFSEVPFLQHYHLDPVDFRRWTHFGFQHLFREFELVSAGVCAGPASALTDMLTEFPALLFSQPALYWGVKNVVGWLFAPLQFLDVLWAGLPRAHVLAGAVYFLGRKPGGAAA